jgi:hypothetical protein
MDELRSRYSQAVIFSKKDLEFLGFPLTFPPSGERTLSLGCRERG